MEINNKFAPTKRFLERFNDINAVMDAKAEGIEPTNAHIHTQIALSTFQGQKIITSISNGAHAGE